MVCSRSDTTGTTEETRIANYKNQYDTMFKIEHIIKESLDANVSLISKVDPSIIGGYILKIGSVMLDGSVKSKLQGLRVSMKGIK